MESDRTQRRKSRFIKRNIIPGRRARRNARDEQSWNASDFSMNGKSGTRALKARRFASILSIEESGESVLLFIGRDNSFAL